MGMNVFELFARISLDGSEYQNALNDASQNTKGFGSTAKGIMKGVAAAGAAAMSAAAAGVVSFGKSSLEAGKNFDSAMSQVAATMGLTMDEMNSETASVMVGTEKFTGTLREFAQYMGSTTAFSATEAAEALNYMALAGYDAQTSMEMLPNVLNLAAAGGMSLGSASDMVTDAQTALGLTLEQTSELVDMMAMASSKTNTSVSQLGDAMLTIGATGRNVAGGASELTQVLGLLADNGIKGAEGGTHLRNMILSLQSPTEDAVDALKNLGVAVYDENGNMRSLQDIFLEMNDAMDGMSQQAKDDIIGTIFNKTDLAAANALLGTNAERWEEISKYLGMATGSAQNMADTQLDNLAGDITLWKSALEGVQIQLSDKITPSFRKMVQTATGALGKIDMSAVGDMLSSWIEAAGTVLDWLAAHSSTIIGVVNTAFGAVGRVFRTMWNRIKTVFDALSEAFTIISGETEGFSVDWKKVWDNVAKISEAANKLVGKAIVAIAKWIAGLIREAKKDGTTMNRIWTGIQSVIQTASSMIGVALDAITKLLNGDFKGAWDAVQPYVQPALDIFNSVSEFLSATFAPVVTNVKDIVDKLKTSFGNIKEKLQPFLDKLSEGKTKFDEYASSGQLAKDIMNAIRNAVVRVSHGLEKVTGWISSAIDWFNKFVLENETLQADITMIWDGVKATFQSAYEGITIIWDAAAPYFKQVWDAIKGYFRLAKLVLGAYFSAAWKYIKGIWDAASGFFKSTWDNIKAVFSGEMEPKVFFKNLFQDAWDLVTAVFDTAVSFFQGIWDGITAVFSSEEGSKSISDVFDTAWTTIKGIWELVEAFFQGTWDGIVAVFGLDEAYKKISGVFTDAWDTVKKKWEGAKKWFDDNVIQPIKKLFNFEFEFPSIKLPHLTYSLIDIPLVGQVPDPTTFGVEWYAKGGIMNSPTMFGVNGNNAMVGGEAGPEAIAPIETLESYIENAVANQIAIMTEKLDAMISGIGDMEINITMPIMLDGKQIGEEAYRYSRRRERAIG